MSRDTAITTVFAASQARPHHFVPLTQTHVPSVLFPCPRLRLPDMHHGSVICRGREAEVPHMVLDALRHTELRSCKRSSRHAEKALSMIRVPPELTSHQILYWIPEANVRDVIRTGPTVA